jgi:DNA polymerase-4
MGSAPGPRWGQHPQTRIHWGLWPSSETRAETGCGSGGAAPSGGSGTKPLTSLPLCLDCARLGCTAPGHRHVHHPELGTLAIAHIDCDAFYASVEKSNRPDLASRPVIVGGGVRGVVTTCCYIARISGVRSAMPMFKALKLCPDAVVIRPDFPRYSDVARRLRIMMGALTPLVQPLSIDEAVLDLTGTTAVHGAPPAVVLARLALRVEAELGITISIGLAANRLLAKLAAERGKPRGFSVLGSEAPVWLATQPVGLLPGIGPAQIKRLAAKGIGRLGDLQTLSPPQARRLLGDEGPALVARARGVDVRSIQPERAAKSISAETTFDSDLAGLPDLERKLWQVCEKLARRLREQDLAAGGLTLKLKTGGFALRTRAAKLARPTRHPDVLFAQGRALLAREADGTPFRLIGMGTTALLPGNQADGADLADPDADRRVARQAALDTLQARFGPGAVARGRGLDLTLAQDKRRK